MNVLNIKKPESAKKIKNSDTNIDTSFCYGAYLGTF